MHLEIYHIWAIATPILIFISVRSIVIGKPNMLAIFWAVFGCISAYRSIKELIAWKKKRDAQKKEVYF